MLKQLDSFFGPSGLPAALLRPAQQAKAAALLRQAFPDLTLYAESLASFPGGLAAAARAGQMRRLLIVGDADGFSGEAAQAGNSTVRVCDANQQNMRALRALLPWLRPVLAGTQPSVGLGDRLGLGTPGHIAAGRDSGFLLFLAQQSIREMTRTGRPAQQVMDEAVFGVFQCGYDAGFGADADHLKTPEDVDTTSAAGFTMFTIDPSVHVDDTVDRDPPGVLAKKFEQLVAGVPGAEGWRKKYVGRAFPAGALEVSFDEPTLMRAAVKYGRAVEHVELMARHIARRAPQHELEVSVDETAQPTSAAEHLFIIHELCERGVKPVSLAPRFVGEFEKGIDYKGDLKVFAASLRAHAAIARHYGPYKLSIHSGSDKFLVYPLVARATGGMLHLKTAGTSYLEALRVVARKDRPFFRELVAFCRGRYETDKASYHVSAGLERVPPAERLKDGELEKTYLDRNDGRQILHVTFGSVLTHTEGGAPKFRGRLLALLDREAETYVAVLKKHLGRHIAGMNRGLSKGRLEA